MKQLLIGLALRQHPILAKRLIKRYYRELSQKAMPQYHAKEYLENLKLAKYESTDILALKQAILTDMVQILPNLQEIDLTHIFTNCLGCLKVKQSVRSSFEGENYISR